MNLENFPLYVMGFLFLVLCLGLFFGIPLSVYDSWYVKPIASEKANQFCMEQGYDFYDTYSRVGFLSKEPIAIKCKYVEQYRDIDLNVNNGED